MCSYEPNPKHVCHPWHIVWYNNSYFHLGFGVVLPSAYSVGKQTAAQGRRDRHESMRQAPWPNTANHILPLWLTANWLWSLHFSFSFSQVRVLFSKGPFIAIFASDPHIIIKAINQNLNSVLRDSNINGHDYMRNIVHLPVFLNSRGLSSAKKMMVASTTNGDLPCSDGSGKVAGFIHIYNMIR